MELVANPSIIFMDEPTSGLDARVAAIVMRMLWKSYTKRPMILVRPSLGAAVAIDFAVNHSEAVKKLVLIYACVYRRHTKYDKITQDTRLRWVYHIRWLKVSVLKSIPVRLYANFLAFNRISLSDSIDWMKKQQGRRTKTPIIGISNGYQPQFLKFS